MGSYILGYKYNTTVSEKDFFPLVTNVCFGAGGRRGAIKLIFFFKFLQLRLRGEKKKVEDRSVLNKWNSASSDVSDVL